MNILKFKPDIGIRIKYSDFRSKIQYEYAVLFRDLIVNDPSIQDELNKLKDFHKTELGEPWTPEK